MLLDPQITEIVALSGAGVGVLGLLTGLAAHTRLRRVRRSYAALLDGVEQGDVLSVASRAVQAVDGMHAEVAAVQAEMGVLRTDVAAAVKHVAVVRYDAFGDMGGRLSFSAAMLDDHGDGMVLTSINGRSETRTYAKGVRDGQSEQSFSPEEEQVVTHALAEARQATAQARARSAGRSGDRPGAADGRAPAAGRR